MYPLGVTQGNNWQVAPSDTIGIAVISSAGAVASFDYPADARYVRFGSTSVFYSNMRSTGASIPTTSVAPSTSYAITLHHLQDQNIHSIDPSATGFSLTAPASGVISMEFWGQ